MRTIYKYELEPSMAIDIPASAKPLSVGWKDNALFMWVELDTNEFKSPRHFQVFGTGRIIDIPDYLVANYIGTAICDTLVWHVYEITRP